MALNNHSRDTFFLPLRRRNPPSKSLRPRGGRRTQRPSPWIRAWKYLKLCHYLTRSASTLLTYYTGTRVRSENQYTQKKCCSVPNSSATPPGQQDYWSGRMLTIGVSSSLPVFADTASVPRPVPLREYQSSLPAGLNRTYIPSFAVGSGAAVTVTVDIPPSARGRTPPAGSRSVPVSDCPKTSRTAVTFRRAPPPSSVILRPPQANDWRIPHTCRP